jgi:hypothetical protein
MNDDLSLASDNNEISNITESDNEEEFADELGLVYGKCQ